MEAFIASLMERIPNKHASLSHRGKFSLVRTITMDIGNAFNIGNAFKHPKGNIRDETNVGMFYDPPACHPKATIPSG